MGFVQGNREPSRCICTFFTLLLAMLLSAACSNKQTNNHVEVTHPFSLAAILTTDVGAEIDDFELAGAG